MVMLMQVFDRFPQYELYTPVVEIVDFSHDALCRFFRSVFSSSALLLFDKSVQAAQFRVFHLLSSSKDLSDSLILLIDVIVFQ